MKERFLEAGVCLVAALCVMAWARTGALGLEFHELVDEVIEILNRETT